MMRPCVEKAEPPRRGKRLALLTGLGMAAGALWRGGATFAGGALAHRPAGGVIIVDELPSGVACRAYGDKIPNRRQWIPETSWRGEKTYKPPRTLQADELRQWWHFDAEGKTLEDLGKAIAWKLRGRDNVLYFPGDDVGGYAIVTNCEKVRVPGKQYHYKLYIRNLSRRPGHCKVERFKDLQKRFPERIVMKAVWDALPKTKGHRRIFKERLKCFIGPNHCYYNENPIDYPMWKIRDCTWESNIPTKERLRTWIKRRGAEVLQLQKDKEEQLKVRQLKEFKDFLAEQLEIVGKDQAKDMSIPEFATYIEKKQADEVFKASEGKDPPKKNIKYYPNTRIPVVKVKHNSLRRSTKWLIQNFR